MKELTSEQIYAKKEKYYRRNFITLLLESFGFSAALSIFSADSVLPVYVSNISDKPIYMALISLLYYGVSYSLYIFACPIGVRAKSPKWVSIGICFLQRIGFMMIFLSTFLVSRNANMALVMFFVSLCMYAFSAGMSNPLFTQMISTSIHRDVGTFYGFYSMIGSASGVLGSLLLTYFLKKYDFPMNYRMIFLVGILLALAATVVVAVGIKEVTDDRVTENLNLKQVLGISKKILMENVEFRHFSMIRMFAGIAEFAIPYYIIVAVSKPDTPQGFSGIMATIFLIAKMISGPILGRIGDKMGPMQMLRVSYACGGVATLLAIFAPNWQISVIMYIFAAFAINGTYMTSSTGGIKYAKGQYVPIYTATVSLLCAPLYIVSALGGAAIADIFSYNAIFGAAFATYLLGFVLSFRYKNES